MGSKDYQLIDFGSGRKLERFGDRLLDRPSPAADGVLKILRPRWQNAESYFHSRTKRWEHRTDWLEPMVVSFDGLSMPISPTPFGHVGVFPEQSANWRWLRATTPKDAGSSWGLNLFAYTGASSIAMASCGMSVAHVDAAKPNVNGCRAAASINGLADHPIRYLVDDAAKFAAREVRRANTYHTVILDPPAYGHSPRGKAWRLERDLWPLLDDCLQLVDSDNFRILITGHSEQVQAADVVDYLQTNVPSILGLSPQQFRAFTEQGRLVLHDEASRELNAGFYVRCHRTS